MADYGRENMTDLSYSVGMLMFAVIYNLVGPDEFNQVVGGFYQQHHTGGASTAQFADHANEVTGAELEPVFRDWLFTTDYRRFIDSEMTLTEIADSYR